MSSMLCAQNVCSYIRLCMRSLFSWQFYWRKLAYLWLALLARSFGWRFALYHYSVKHAMHIINWYGKLSEYETMLAVLFFLYANTFRLSVCSTRRSWVVSMYVCSQSVCKWVRKCERIHLISVDIPLAKLIFGAWQNTPFLPPRRKYASKTTSTIRSTTKNG